MRNGRIRILATLLLLSLGACASFQPAAQANRPDGEGYAGVGELLVRIRVLQDNAGWFESLMPRKNQRAMVEIRYLGINPAGRAVFERHDVDLLAGPPPAALSSTALPSDVEPSFAAAGLPADTRQILLDLRLARQIRVQGKIIEILEASATGVVFRLY